MRTEHRLLIALDLCDPHPDRVARLLESQRDAIVWPELVAIAAEHALLPLLLRALATAGGATVPAAVPSDVAAGLRHDVALESGRSLRFSLELIRTLDRLAAAGVPVLPIKGPTLAVAAYGSLALRPFGDLDLLIRPGDAATAHRALAAAGYRPVERFPTEVHFIHDELALCLDLHLATSDHEVPFDPPFDRLHERRTTVELLGRRVSVLAPEDTLLLLCAQLIKELYAVRIRYGERTRLIKVLDIAALLGSWTPDWPALFDRAAEFHAGRLLLTALGFVEAFVELPLPDAVRARCQHTPLRSSFPGPEAHYVFGPLPPRFSRLDRIHFQLRVRDRLRDRLELAFRPNELDQIAMPLPQRLRFLHHVTRPLRVGVAYGRDLLGGLRGPARGR